MTGIAILSIVWGERPKVVNQELRIRGMSQEQRKPSFHVYTVLITTGITAIATVFIGETWRSSRERADYRLSYQIETKPYRLEKGSLFGKKPYPGTMVKIQIQNLGRKAQTGVGLYVRFKEPILFTYVPRELPICDNEGNSLSGNSTAFKGENSAGVNIQIIPSGIRFPITFILDCQYRKEMQKELVDFITLASGEK